MYSDQLQGKLSERLRYMKPEHACDYDGTTPKVKLNTVDLNTGVHEAYEK